MKRYGQWLRTRLKQIRRQYELPTHRAVSALLRDHGEQTRLRAEMDAAAKSNGSRYYEPFPLRVGIVSDEFVFRCFQDTCSLIPIVPSVSGEELRSLELLLVVSTWRGLDGTWYGAGEAGTEANLRLHAIMGECREAGIPVVFYSKEDPPNFDYFRNLAGEADTIFTSAAEMVERYQSLFPHTPVYPLSFAVNPVLYNPVGLCGRQERERAIFAGSWITKYPERINAQRTVFRWLREAGVPLCIVDRNDSRNLLRYRYPLRYQRSVQPAIPYEELGAAYKLHTWVVNFNSVTDSETMFAMRVYDAMACGSLVLSNGSVGMERLFPEALVLRRKEDLKAALAMDGEERYLRRVNAVRRIFNHGNTAFERMEELLGKSGFSVSRPSRRVGVLVEAGASEGLRQMLSRQTYGEKCLIRYPEEAALAEDCAMLTIWKEGRQYGPRYLEDMVSGFRYTDCDYVTKRSDVEYIYVNEIEDKYGTLFWRSAVTPEELAAMAEHCRRENGFAADRLSYSRTAQGTENLQKEMKGSAMD